MAIRALKEVMDRKGNRGNTRKISIARMDPKSLSALFEDELIILYVGTAMCAYGNLYTNPMA